MPMNDQDLTAALADALRVADNDVDTLLALEALSRVGTTSADEAILAFLRSGSDPDLAHAALGRLSRRAPALLVPATQDAHPAVAAAAQRALLREPADEALPFYLRLLKSRSTDDITSGLASLGRLSSPEVRAPLLKALTHRSPSVRLEAANAIRRCADGSWVSDLLEAIGALRREEKEKKKDFSEIIETLCATVVNKAETAQRERLMQGLDHDDARVRRTCIDALGRVGDEAAVTILCERLDDIGASAPLVWRDAVVKALGQLGDPRAIGPLRRLGAKVTAKALGQLNALEAAPDLVAALEQARSPRDADELAAELARLVGPGDQHWPRVGLSSTSLPVRRAAALQLATSDPDAAVAPLRELLNEVPPGDAIAVAEVLVRLGDEQGWEGFSKALANDPHHWNASAVASACAKLRGPRVHAQLLELLPRINREYVHNVCQAMAAQGADLLPSLISAATAGEGVNPRYTSALSEFRDPAGAALLAPLLLGKHPLRDGAMLSLMKTPDARTSEALVAVLAQATQDDERARIVETLAYVATKEAMPVLEDAMRRGIAVASVMNAQARQPNDDARSLLIGQLTSQDSEVRSEAADALLQLADPAASQPLFDLLLRETQLSVVHTALAAWLKSSTTDDVEVTEGLQTPGTRALVLAELRRLEGQESVTSA